MLVVVQAAISPPLKCHQQQHHHLYDYQNQQVMLQMIGEQNQNHRQGGHHLLIIHLPDMHRIKVNLFAYPPWVVIHILIGMPQHLIKIMLTRVMLIKSICRDLRQKHSLNGKEKEAI